MSRPPLPTARLERVICDLLRFGTWLASALIAAGLALAPFGPSGPRVVTAGIALLVLLPVARVAVMLVAFARARDYAFGAIAAAVLVILSAGFVVGLHMARAG